MQETVILNFEVDQNKAESQLEKLEGLLIDNRKAQQELTKAYKTGIITQEEYIKENLRLQQNIKKEQEQKKTIIKLLDAENNSINALTERNKALRKERNNLDLTTDSGIKKLDLLNKQIDKNDKAIQKNVSLLEKQKLNIGNYASALDVVVPGTAAFFNQSTALAGALGTTAKAVQATGFSLQTLNAIPVVAVVTGIVAAYTLLNAALDDTAQKTAIAKDRQETYNRELKNTEGILRAIDAAIQEEEDTRNKAFEESIDKANVLADRIQRLAGITNDAAKEETEGYENRLSLLTQSVALYDQESAIRIKAIEDYKAAVLLLDESGNVIDSLLTKEETLALDDRLNSISDSYTKTVASLKKDIEDLNFVIAQTRRDANAPDVSLAQSDGPSSIDDGIVSASKARQDQFISELKTVEFTESQKRDQAIQTAALREKLDREAIERERATADGFLAIGSSLANGLSALAKEGSEEQKALAITGLAIDTASAIGGAVASAQTVGYPGNLVAMASAIAAILGAIAEAKAIGGFAEGGWTGPGNKYDAVGVVHADEYVVPKSINNSPAAQPHLAALERMRTGYADGGYVANSNTQSANNSLMIANAFINQPPVWASWVEGRATGRKLEFKERKSRI